MKNLKKIAFGLLVAVLAVGFSAFTSSNESSKRLDFRYANVNGEYIQVDNTASTDDCLSGGMEQCLIESNEDLESFPYNDKPADWQPVTNSSNGVYTP